MFLKSKIYYFTELTYTNIYIYLKAMFIYLFIYFGCSKGVKDERHLIGEANPAEGKS